MVAPDKGNALFPQVTPLSRRAPGDPVKVRIDRKEWRDIQRRRDLMPGSEGHREIILGPFFAKDEEDVQILQRHMGLDRQSVLQGKALSNARAWLQRRKILEEESDLYSRQTEAEQECFVGNDQLSCYPTSGTKFIQGQWGRVSLYVEDQERLTRCAQLIWNSNYPEFTNRGDRVDIYLFHQDNDQLLQSWTDVDNGQGRLSFMPDDSWWQGRTAADNFNGTDIDWPFYFVITYAGEGLGGTTHRLSTWYAVRESFDTV